ncbi:Holliday junction DNA helicase RuvA [Pullulanibacillus pueri]|uniref:Holliday junction branch migration complex subunit RuvA n=1 Tax=Pullulanibacillus pueri TaxID=1437324 RepID=A0A8J2ZXV9_9BACL|nr:Holliday junction branch migration protein RuvA [Pullulanibacillus pueri]MBM7683275.1 Holliday junction DNA helicase RuvA [Pullulanibacillus pueri]GGH85802.1 Holliday junction ATP-dependent DNA helicase RuvA [Pullulanibacillus pueri]
MIEFIQGTIAYVNGEAVTIENHGIGYLIYCPNPFSFQPIGQEMKIYTYQYVREDALHLYGFKTREERALFIHLLSVSGIGPKGALAILATGEPQRVIQAIEAEDETFLVKFPGIGKKTARQMILDLKGKVKASTVISSDGEPMEKDVQQGGHLEEAIQALQALGYSEREIKKIVPNLKDKALSAEQYVKEALKLMLNQ